MTDDWPIFGRDVEGVAWRPTRESVEAARLTRFLRSTGEPTLDALQAHAVADPGWFWGAAAEDIGIAWGRPPRQVLDLTDGPAWARWWGGAEFDYARAATEPRAARDPDGEALVWEGEDGDVRRLTNAELAAAVDIAARRLSALGVGAGDRVGILLPMLVETVVAVLALGRLQAIYTPIFSGYGAPAIATRLADCEASVLITADGFLRRGAWVPLKAVADEAVADAPTVRRVVVVRRAGDGDRDAVARRARRLVGHPGAGRGGSASSVARSTPRRRTCSSTPRARPDGPRAPSTSTAASRSRPRRTSRTSSTWAPATRCSGSPTSAG